MYAHTNNASKAARLAKIRKLVAERNWADTDIEDQDTSPAEQSELVRLALQGESDLDAWGYLPPEAGLPRIDR